MGGGAVTAAGYALLAAALILAAAVIVWSRLRLRRTMDRLDRMLDKAIGGQSLEEHFDESRLSALEAKLARYVTSNAVSVRALARQKNQISTLVSDISHQTRTPVADLLLYTQLLEEQPLDEQARACVQVLSAQAGKLQALIEALVKTSRLETGLLALHPQQGPIAPMMRRAADQYALQAAQKELALTVEPLDSEAVFDPKWTEEALCILLDNAVKYTPAGGRVTVGVRPYELFTAIQVRDTGPGIPEEEHAKIFGRFYRAQTAYCQEGVGIGLYLARQIMEGQGGYVKLESRLGRGSVFSLYLPRS